MNPVSADARPSFTPRQGQYLAFIHAYRCLHGLAPAEAELPPAFLDTPLSEEPAMVKLSMNEIERTAAAADGPVVSEGGCSPSTLSTGQRAASQGGTPPTASRPGPLAPGRRWSAGRKREVVLRLLRGEA